MCCLPKWRPSCPGLNVLTHGQDLYLFMSVDELAAQGTKPLTHGGRVTHICVGNLTIIGPDNGLSPGRRQAIIWTNAGILLIGPWGTNFSEILIGIQAFSYKKMHLKMSPAKWRPFCLGFNVLMGMILPGLQCEEQLVRNVARLAWQALNGQLPTANRLKPASDLVYGLNNQHLSNVHTSKMIPFLEDI